MAEVTAVVDFGTTHTVAVVSGNGSPAQLVPVDGEPWFPSAVFWGRDGLPVVGGDALRLARSDPARLEHRPKARLAEEELLLGDAVVPVGTLVRAVLGRVLTEAGTVVGAPVQHLVLTHPADWGSIRLGALLAAAQGLAPRVSTTAEPVAAAARFARDHELPVGASLGVLDFGGGTCDAAVVRREAAGYTVAGCAGLPDLGGEDLDERIVGHLLAARASLTELFAGGRVLPAPALAERARLREDIRAAKEVLSRYPQTEVVLPGGLGDILVTRPEFEALVRDDVARAVRLLDETVRGCGLRPGDLRAVHLVGGSSRVPMLAKLLHEWTSTPIRLDDQPEAVVAFGAHELAVPTAATPPAAEQVDSGEQAATAPDESTVDSTSGSGDADTPRRGPSRRLPAVAVAVVTLLVGTVVLGAAGVFRQTVRGYAAELGGSAAADRATLPPPLSGNPMSVPGRPTDLLPTVRMGQPVEWGSESEKVRWTADEFTDSDEMSAALGALNFESDDYRWALLKVTVEAVADDFYPYVGMDTSLVDDRGMMLSPTDGAKLPEGCADHSAAPSMRAGERRQLCLAYQLPKVTPVVEVALSVFNATNPVRPGSELLDKGARVPVNGKRVSGQPSGNYGDRLPFGVFQQVPSSEGPTVDIAAVDLIEDMSGYFNGSDPVGTPGYRALVMRLSIRTGEPVSTAMFHSRAFLFDDRGTTMSQAGYSPEGGDCMDSVEDEEIETTGTVCLLFAVPTGARVAGAGVAAPEEPILWKAP